MCIPTLDIILNNSILINDNDKIKCEFCNEYYSKKGILKQKNSCKNNPNKILKR